MIKLTQSEYDVIKKFTFDINKLNEMDDKQKIEKLFLMYLDAITKIGEIHFETGYCVSNGCVEFWKVVEPNIEYII